MSWMPGVRWPTGWSSAGPPEASRDCRYSSDFAPPQPWRQFRCDGSRDRRYDPGMPLNSGATFAGYTILRLLGPGGMARSTWPSTPGCRVATRSKSCRTDNSRQRLPERFHREAELAATLWHPTSSRVHDRGEFDGQLWIAMDYVEGADAAHWLKDRYPAGMPDRTCAPSSPRWPGHSTTPTSAGYCTATSSRPTSAHRPEDGQRRILLADFGIARPSR